MWEVLADGVVAAAWRTAAGARVAGACEGAAAVSLAAGVGPPAIGAAGAAGVV
jgi:hypothetical protein